MSLRRKCEPGLRATCCYVGILRIPLVKGGVIFACTTGKAACCHLAVTVWYGQRAGNVLLRDCFLHVPLIAAIGCCGIQL